MGCPGINKDKVGMRDGDGKTIQEIKWSQKKRKCHHKTWKQEPNKLDSNLDDCGSNRHESAHMGKQTCGLWCQRQWGGLKLAGKSRNQTKTKVTEKINIWSHVGTFWHFFKQKLTRRKLKKGVNAMLKHVFSTRACRRPHQNIRGDPTTNLLWAVSRSSKGFMPSPECQATNFPGQNDMPVSEHIFSNAVSNATKHATRSIWAHDFIFHCLAREKWAGSHDFQLPRNFVDGWQPYCHTTYLLIFLQNSFIWGTYQPWDLIIIIKYTRSWCDRV